MDRAKFPLRTDSVFLSNKDGSYKVMMGDLPGLEQPTCSQNKKAIEEHKWRDGDFLSATYPKCGTHLVWEIMSMLLNGRAEYMELSQVTAMIGITPFETIDENFPSPRVLNLHYSLDVLPDEFQNRKTVCVIRNPKDTLVSYFNMVKRVVHPMWGMDPDKLTLEKFFDEFLNPVETVVWGSYFKFVESMWEYSKTHPNLLILFFEDIVQNPAENVRKLNEFMGISRDDKLLQEITDAIEFKKMKEGKLKSELLLWPEVSSEDSVLNNYRDTLPDGVSVFRKGVIGDWKNWLTVAMNERFDNFLQSWKLAQEIPFIFE